MIEQHHQPIAKHFCTGEGRSLMTADGWIAQEVWKMPWKTRGQIGVRNLRSEGMKANDEISKALDRNLTSPNVWDSNGEPANVVDVLQNVANGLLAIAEAVMHLAGSEAEQAGEDVPDEYRDTDGKPLTIQHLLQDEEWGRVFAGKTRNNLSNKLRDVPHIRVKGKGNPVAYRREDVVVVADRVRRSAARARGKKRQGKDTGTNGNSCDD